MSSHEFPPRRLPYRQDITACLAGAIGDSGLGARAYEALLEETAGSLAALRSHYRDGSLPFLTIADRDDDLAALVAVAEHFRASFDHVVVIGTGGSSLGGKALCALGDDSGPKITFLDNIDPHTFNGLLGALDFARTGFIVISKSGTTPETLSLFLAFLEAAVRLISREALADHFTLITQPSSNPLRRLGDEYRLRLLDHDSDLGGRFSVLSNVGLLPALIAGVDGGALRAGARAAFSPVLDGAAPCDCPAAVGAALAVGLSRQGVNMSVLMPYMDRLADLSDWFRQLWAESLGKDTLGTTPINALGTVDQHSQLQLYLSGPRDKMFTLLMAPSAGTGARIFPEFAADGDLSWLAGRTMGDLLEAEATATVETLRRNKRPVRLFEIDVLDETSLGGLLMHYMLETVIAADLLGVNAYDQPAVEEGKILAKDHLSRLSPSAEG